MITFRQNTRAIKAILSSLVVFLIVSLLMVETLSAETRYRVKSSDNVNTIVERYYPNSELSRGQLLVGILIENPRAFKGGNINFLLRGKRLTLPDESDFQQISPAKASEVLSEHARFFRFGIAGNLPAPILSEMKADTEELDDPNDILLKQKSQTKKFDQLQKESNELKQQLEVLLSEKTDRDQRLLELEESLKQSLNINKQSSVEGDFVKALELEESNKLRQKRLNRTKNELTENLKLNTSSERKVEDLQEVLEDKNTAGGEVGQRTIESSVNILSKLVWLIPLFLLALFLIYLFTKKKNTVQADEGIKVNSAGYIEPYDDNATELQDSAVELEESSLETSVKLDVARAYIEAEDTQSALDILTEIMEEGSDEQRQQAHDLLETISSS